MNPNNTKNTKILDKIKDCIIDDDGVFKYIQVNITDITNITNITDNTDTYNKSDIIENYTPDSICVIRGFLKFEYHKQIFEDLQNEVDNTLNLKGKVSYLVNGGGRIEINKLKQTIFVYGYSKSYGYCDHRLSVELFKEYYPNYDVTWSNQGY